MLLVAETDDEANTENAKKLIEKPSYDTNKILWLSIYSIFLLSMIITVSIMHDLPSESFSLIIIGMIATAIAIIKRCINIRKKSKNKNQEIQSRNNPTLVVNINSIILSVFTIFFVASTRAPADYGYGLFGTFVLYLFTMLILIWMLTLIIHFLIKFTHLIGNVFSVSHMDLSPKTVSFFLASFLTSSLIIYVTSIPANLSVDGLIYGIAFILSFMMFIDGIIVNFLSRSNLLVFISSILSLIGLIGVVFFLYSYLNDGFNTKIDVTIPSERFPTNFTHDPSQDGNYSYSFLTYGSGSDRRIDYGSKASIITPTIDLSSLIRLSSFNRNFFKFNESSLPLNGRIWYPKNKTGPYPIVVMVHGNHLSTESSEIGYDYLCQMLASQGFIAVSIDENFLNDAPTGSSLTSEKASVLKTYPSGTKYASEYIARAIIILETLKQFRMWNKDKKNRFYKQFDLSNIGLMGHSRGGETIVIASVLNQLNYLPEFPSNIQFTDYNFNIKVLFSIAGTGDSYMPLGRNLHFSDISLFAIHGIYDGDVPQFSVQSTMTNLKFLSNSTYNFKASLYVHQANHGQFNNDWGRYDKKFGTEKFFNVRPLMNMKDQQHICKIYMSALMKFLLKNQKEYQILFEDYRSIINYLPYTNYISTFQDSNEIIIADFENYDVTKGQISGSTINVTHLALWSSVYIQSYSSSMLLLQPMASSTGIYNIHLSKPLNGSKLRFMVGRTEECLVDYLIVRLAYENKTFDSFNVRVLPALTKQIFKISSKEYVFAMQTISLSLNPSIVEIDFRMNGANAIFFIDNIVIVK